MSISKFSLRIGYDSRWDEGTYWTRRKVYCNKAEDLFSWLILLSNPLRTLTSTKKKSPVEMNALSLGASVKDIDLSCIIIWMSPMKECTGGKINYWVWKSSLLFLELCVFA